MPADEMAILGASASGGMVLTPNLAQSWNILSPASEQLNHCGLVPYGNSDLGQHWLR